MKDRDIHTRAFPRRITRAFASHGLLSSRVGLGVVAGPRLLLALPPQAYETKSSASHGTSEPATLWRSSAERDERPRGIGLSVKSVFSAEARRVPG